MNSFRQRLRNRWPYLKAVIAPRSYTEPSPWTHPRSWPPPLAETADTRAVAAKLGKGFIEHGSDKATIHDYHIPYARSLLAVPKGGCILEIGIGTTDVSVPSNMGPKGIAGASLRAWLESGFFSDVVGADIDRNILFVERGIRTEFVDQLDVSTLRKLAISMSETNPTVTLVVDDGLHTSKAILNTLDALWPIVSQGGYYVIEDLCQITLHEVLPWAISIAGSENWSIWSNLNVQIDSQMLILRKW